MVNKIASSHTKKATERFQASPLVLFLDKFFNVFIKTGGILVIVATLAIFVFILSQVFPLFQKASVKLEKTISLPQKNYALLGCDEWAEQPFLLTNKGELLFIDLSSAETTLITEPLSFPNSPTSFQIKPKDNLLLIGFDEGTYASLSINYKKKFAENETFSQKIEGTIVHSISKPEYHRFDEPGKVLALDQGESDESLVVGGILETTEGKKIKVISYVKRGGLLGKSKPRLEGSYDLTSFIEGTPQKILIPSSGESVLIVNDEGSIFFLYKEGDQFTLRQKFTPFEDKENKQLSVCEFIFGDASLLTISADGVNRLYSIFLDEDRGFRQYALTKEFTPLPSSGKVYTTSLRNKSFLVTSGSTVSLRHGTTAAVRWEEKVHFIPVLATINKKFNKLLLLGENNNLYTYSLHDPHPESGWKAFFGKIWYEGSSKPDFTWQSTGGSNEFEPKLSLVPLIYGTFKGTLYAMLFAIPIALLAAIYTSQFLHPTVKAIVKPAMEIMASLPSVVIGFMAALWLAPHIEDKVPSILLIFIGIPAVSLVFGNFWGNLPVHLRSKIRPGWEFAAFLPILFVTIYVCWQAGPYLERFLFTVEEDSGRKIADFRYWWTQTTGLAYEQRNSLVVGFMMGFAVIPMIFTIAEDALSSVPNDLRSASFACGASRWQTVRNIVLPIASSGIFSAIMIGFARAVGETMIVVMATGNTPIMDWNLFSGMRTLSANIAVELPEAPQHGTLYRTLFLGALVLFIITSFINTIAELLRQHLRNKFRTV